MKFKVGDKVKVLDNRNSDCVNVGDIATIRIVENRYGTLPYNCINKEGYRLWVGNKHIELVETEAETKVENIDFEKLGLSVRDGANLWKLNADFVVGDVCSDDYVISIQTIDESDKIETYCSFKLEQAKKIRDTINNIITYFEQNAKTKKKMTLKEIEDKLGYKIEIV